MWYVEYGDEDRWRESEWYYLESEAEAEAERLEAAGFDDVHVQCSDPFEPDPSETLR
jgi:hypothetical protein